MADDNTNEVKTEESVKPVEQKVDQPQAAPVAPAAVSEEAKKAPTKGLNKTVIIAVVVALLLGGGWYYKQSSDKSKEEKAAEALIESLTGQNYDIDGEEESINIKDEESGESVSIESNQKIPSDFPKDSIPYLDEKSVTFVITSTNEGKKYWSVTTAVDESVEEAVAFFEAKFVEPDYTDISSYGYNESKTLSATSTEYSMFVTINKAETDTDTTVSYVVEEL
ncbi:MAG: hypothetical protein Q7T41_00300 [Candidatus Saccharibacteria bacterium]|nr:hypothetical protein [Candidatus Saccharibacteria bacterium]